MMNLFRNLVSRMRFWLARKRVPKSLLELSGKRVFVVGLHEGEETDLHITGQVDFEQNISPEFRPDSTKAGPSATSFRLVPLPVDVIKNFRRSILVFTSLKEAQRCLYFKTNICSTSGYGLLNACTNSISNTSNPILRMLNRPLEDWFGLEQFHLEQRDFQLVVDPWSESPKVITMDDLDKVLRGAELTPDGNIPCPAPGLVLGLPASGRKELSFCFSSVFHHYDVVHCVYLLQCYGRAVTSGVPAFVVVIKTNPGKTLDSLLLRDLENGLAGKLPSHPAAYFHLFGDDRLSWTCDQFFQPIYRRAEEKPKAEIETAQNI